MRAWNAFPTGHFLARSEMICYHDPAFGRTHALARYAQNGETLMFMSGKLPSSRVILMGLLAGVVAGSLGGCSRPGPTDVDVQKARAALRKRWAGYGEVTRSSARQKKFVPAQHTRTWAPSDPPG